MSQRICIESMSDEKGGTFIQVLDAETKEPLEDLSSVVIKLVVNNIVVAEVSYVDGATQERYVEKLDAVISDQAIDKHEEVEGFKEASQEV